MDHSKDSQYYKAYIAGYCAGVADAYTGNVRTFPSNDSAGLPIEAMELSTRACNCLLRSGCKTVADVFALDEHTVRTMRNLGTKTASEIANWMIAHGYCCDVWSQYL